jgi:two-component system chemotaxis sensor kinase CheA
MAEPPNSAPQQADALLQQFGLELAFVEPGRPGAGASLVAIVGKLQPLCGQAPAPIGVAIAACLRWLDGSARSAGVLTAADLENLGAWQPWMVTAVMAWDRGQAVPVPPEAWVAAAGATIPPSNRLATTSDADVLDQPVGVLPGDLDEELGQMFCAEAQDLLQDIEQGVLTLESNAQDQSTIDTVFRAFHTFKGNSSMLKLAVLQRLAHELESLLDQVRRGKMALTRDSIDLILKGSDVIRQYVDEMSRQLGGVDRGRTIRLPVQRIIADVHALLAGKPATPVMPATRATPATPAVAASTVVAPAVIASEVAAPEVAKPAVAVAVELPTREPERTPPAMTAEMVSTEPAVAAPAGVVRVDTLKLDSLIDLVGELVVAQSQVVQSQELKGIANEHLARSLSQLRSITSDLQRTAMSLRMVPIRGTFRKMTRLVRDLAGDLGKEINLRLEGEETELDRTVVEELSDPLVHMIRNSADHGIELPGERAAAGKPAAGTITLKAFHQGGFIVVQIEDDGRGLNTGRILAKAVERGLVNPQESLEESQILDLIFMPGFSTAEQVTGLSGRGVGMDVVRRNIEKIRGKVEVESVPGKGTRFTTYVPLTLAIIEGLLVGVGDQRYIIPTLSVQESFRPLPGTVTTVQGRGELISVRGRLTPLLRLGRHLNTPSKADDPSRGIVVVVESGQDSRCLFVDELIGKQEVVIKSLGDVFRDQHAFAGAAILGDGRVGLILDVNALVKLKAPAGEAAA